MKLVSLINVCIYIFSVAHVKHSNINGFVNCTLVKIIKITLTSETTRESHCERSSLRASWTKNVLN